jgi:hypothetical protein
MGVFVFSADSGDATNQFARPYSSWNTTISPSTENNCQIPSPAAGTIRNLVLKCTTGNVGGTRAFTVRKNGVNQTLTATIANGASLAQDTTNSFSVAVGDLVSVILGSTLAGTEVIYIMMTGP